MANRNDPGVRQHETLPGPGPGRKTLSLPVGVRPVEQMMDAAIERIEREHHASHVSAHVAESHALALPEHGAPTRLRWKGLDVSDEFRSYAERVARGENLPPFAGRVLAEPNAEFPWGSPARSDRVGPGRGGQLALWASAAVVMGLLAWSVALRFEAIEPPSALVNVAAPAANDPATLESFSAPVRRELGASPALQAGIGAPRGQSVAARPNLAAEPVPQPHVTEAPGAAGPERVATVPSAPVAAAAVPVSVAPAATEPAPAPPPALVSVPALAAAPVPNPATASVPAPAPKPAASTRLPDMDFGIDELPLAASRSSVAGAKPAAGELGSVGDLDRASSSPTTAARKEPGKESSAKGSLLVDTPSF